MRIVSDNLQITSKRIEAALSDFDPDPIQSLVLAAKEKGAQVIDINSGPLSRHPEEKMQFLVTTVQDAVDLPLVIDTSNPVAMEAGLEVCRGKAIINGFSLEPARLDFMLPLAATYEADIIGYLLTTESHVPPDADGRLEVAVRLYDEFKKAGLKDSQLIIDPVVAPLVWQDGNQQNMAILEVLSLLPDLLGFNVRTIAGLSNLTTSAPNLKTKQVLEPIYLAMLSAAGLDMVLLNVFHEKTMETARWCNALRSDAVFTWVTS